MKRELKDYLLFSLNN